MLLCTPDACPFPLLIGRNLHRKIRRVLDRHSLSLRTLFLDCLIIRVRDKLPKQFAKASQLDHGLDVLTFISMVMKVEGIEKQNYQHSFMLQLRPSVRLRINHVFSSSSVHGRQNHSCMVNVSLLQIRSQRRQVHMCDKVTQENRWIKIYPFPGIFKIKQSQLLDAALVIYVVDLSSNYLLA